MSWNTCALLRACLDSLQTASQLLKGPTQIIVVDNASVDGTVGAVQREYPGVTVVANAGNRGFAAATNQGIALSTGQYVLILNPDTEMAPQSLAKLVEFMEARVDAAAVGPKVAGRDGMLQDSCFPLPTVGREIWRLFWLERLWPLASYPLRRWQSGGPRPVEAIQGACLLVRRSVLLSLDALDEHFYIYTEEVDLCRRIKDAGWNLFWFPEASIIHHGGQSTRQAAPRMFLELYRSKIQYFRKHAGRWNARLYKVVLAAAAIPRIVLPAMVWLPRPGRRAEFEPLIRNYSSLLRLLPVLGQRTSAGGERAAIAGEEREVRSLTSGSSTDPVCSVVVVCRDNKESLERCLRSLQAARMRNPLEVVVVDNGSEDGTPEMVRTTFPRITLLQNDCDRGLGPASNQGIEATQAPYVLLLSSAAVVDGNALDVLIDFMAATPGAAAAGGTLRNEDGSFHAAYNRFSSLLEEFLIATGIGKLIWPGYPSHHTHSRIRAVDWVCSACLLLRRAALANVGLLEERFSTYGDEADFQYRLVRGGWKVYYVPDATTTIVSNGHADRWRRRKLVYRGKMLFYKWNYGPVKEIALRAMLGTLTLGKVAAWSLAWPVPHLHERAARELRSNTEVLRLCVRLE